MVLQNNCVGPTGRSKPLSVLRSLRLVERFNDNGFELHVHLAGIQGGPRRAVILSPVCKLLVVNKELPDLVSSVDTLGLWFL
jgi:hypothetical protein